MSNLRKLTKLLIDFHKSPHVTLTDFIQVLLQEDKVQDGNEIDTLVSVINHEKFLKALSNEFLRKYKLYNINEEHLTIQFHFLIFKLDEDVIDNFIERIYFYTQNLLEFLSSDSNYTKIAETACCYFENDYVVDKIVKPLSKKKNLILEITEEINERIIEKSRQLSITVPREFKCFKKNTEKSPSPPPPSPRHSREITCHKPQKTIVFEFKRVQDKVNENHLNNAQQTELFFKETAKVPDRLPQPKKSFTLPKAKKPPPKNDVEIKGNLTTTLREASRLLKQQEEEINKIEDMIKGGCYEVQLKEIEEQHRQEQEDEKIKSIQKKHLQGLLTYEEAILAKQKLIENNKNKVREFKEARLEWLDKLETWKEDEQKKIQAQIEKCQQMKLNRKESEKKLLEEKQNQVRLQQYNTKELMKKAAEEKEKELVRKIEIIQEIRTLHEISMQVNATKEFDPTETANLGLMCEMSIAELQERLIIAKMKTKQDLEDKRKLIARQKLEQQEMVENAKNFISQARQRMSKPKTVPISTTKLEQSPDLLELRKLLQEKRNLRMKTR